MALDRGKWADGHYGTSVGPDRFVHCSPVSSTPITHSYIIDISWTTFENIVAKKEISYNDPFFFFLQQSLRLYSIIMHTFIYRDFPYFRLHVRLLQDLLHVENLFIYLLGFYAALNNISVLSRRQFTFSWSLGKQTRLENVPCPRAFHHDRSATTGDRTWATRFRNLRR